MSTQGTVTPSPYQVVMDDSGSPASGAKIYTYLAGTTTAAATYTDSTMATPCANPIIADAAGRYVAFLAPGQSYKFVIQDATGAAIRTVDGISAVPASAANLDVLGTAGEALLLGDVAYLSDGSGGKTAGRWYKSQAGVAAYASSQPVVGMATANIASAVTGTIRVAGVATSVTTLVPGTAYYVSSATAGAVSITGTSTYARSLGVAVTTSSLLLSGWPGRDAAVSGSPVGAIEMFAGAAAPAGYLLCRGQEVSQTTYAALYAVCSTLYNTGGETSGNFRVPDLQQRFPIGKATAGTGSTLGGSGGAIDHTHTLTTANVNGGPTELGVGSATTSTNNPPFLSVNFIIKF
jgi:hypothetical protein